MPVDARTRGRHPPRGRTATSFTLIASFHNVGRTYRPSQAPSERRDDPHKACHKTVTGSTARTGVVEWQVPLRPQQRGRDREIETTPLLGDHGGSQVRQTSRRLPRTNSLVCLLDGADGLPRAGEAWKSEILSTPALWGDELPAGGLVTCGKHASNPTAASRRERPRTAAPT